MTFIPSYRCRYPLENRFNSDFESADPAYRCGIWLLQAKENINSRISKKIMEYLESKCDPVIYEILKEEAADKKIRNVLYVQGRKYSPYMITDYFCLVPDVTKDNKEPYIGHPRNPIMIEDLDDEAGVLLDAMDALNELITLYDSGTNTEQKKIYQTVFNDDDKELKELCEEVFA